MLDSIKCSKFIHGSESSDPYDTAPELYPHLFPEYTTVLILLVIQGRK
jgi:hypothetical protein